MEPKGNLTLPPTSKPTALLRNFNLIIKKKRGEEREGREGGRNRGIRKNITFGVCPENRDYCAGDLPPTVLNEERL